jgi:hypothetical protein
MAIKRNITGNNDTHVSNADGFVQKRFKLSQDRNAKVETFRRKLSLKMMEQGINKEPVWEDALSELIDTHPKLKNL